MTFDPSRVNTFHYLGFDIDPSRGEVSMHYALDQDVRFCERLVVPDAPADAWGSDFVIEAARLLYLLAGVSYYKAAAPSRIDLGATTVRPGEHDFLTSFYVDGLGEYAHRNGMDLSGLEIVGGVVDDTPPRWPAVDLQRPLIPFGGGIDSIVTVEALRRQADDPALFVMSRHGQRYAAIEDAAAVAALPVLRAEQHLDPQILRSAELGFHNGHVPITGVLSAMAVLVAALHRRGAVVMSNEWSASIGNLQVDGRQINHQYSKSWAFETRFRELLRGAFHQPPAYFSFLRPYSELWVAQRFATLGHYHHVFRSCNRAFHVDPRHRFDLWCGRCDKCCFIDLILAPFMSPSELGEVFGGSEPLGEADLAEQFRTLLGLSEDPKPFECVGDVHECRAAAMLAAARPDRRSSSLLHTLVADIETAGLGADDTDRLLAPLGPTCTPDEYTSSDQLV